MARFTLTALAVHLLLGTLATCEHHHVVYDFGIDVGPLVKRKTEQPIVVAPLQKVDGTVPLRHEIRELEKNKDQWTLYILGLSMMQFVDQSEPLSWYQIAGIHGAPYQPWSGVEGVADSQYMGYCHHRDILFPTWHRPYISLYEGMLHSTIEFIASLWPQKAERERYQAAAADFRIPYWDWAVTPPKGESVLPRSVWGDSMIDVDGPNGVQKISNPLFAYGFKPLDTSAFPDAPWDMWVSTMRAPTSENKSAQSNNRLVAMNLDGNLPSFQQRLYTLFSNYKNYTTFSNEGWIPDRSNSSYDSLESLHDAIHALTGGRKGHMSIIPFSAFDPLFFLHHAMVDRLFAMWQALYPEAWIKPEVTSWGTFTTPSGQIVNSTTALTPFFANSDGIFWTSDTARDPRTFGYTYAEVAGLDLGGGKIDSRAQASIKLIINRLYGGSSPPSLVGVGKSNSAEVVPSLDEGGGGRVGTPSSVEPGRSVIVHNQYREWVANIRVEKKAPGGTFFIHFFFGDIPKDTQTWAHAPNLVGTMCVFAAPGRRGMGHQGPDTRGTVPLTAALVKEALAGVLPGLEADVVEPYLKEKLRFGMIGVDGTVFDPANVAGLDIQITSSSVQVPTSDNELPAWGKTVSHFNMV